MTGGNPEGDWIPLLPGIDFVGYRSFATEWQAMEFPTKVTVLAGTNNSRKSNVLHFLQTGMPTLQNTTNS